MVKTQMAAACTNRSHVLPLRPAAAGGGRGAASGIGRAVSNALNIQMIRAT